ncbi:MAG: EAL domain-containing protein [Planctomycetales bacterium]|nr:EAL domain-containing protein [Planctomycetales bacterium]
MPDPRNATDFETSRLSRIAPIVIVCGTAWGGFGIYYLCTARHPEGTVCLVEAVGSFMIAWLAKLGLCQNRRTAISYIVFVTVGLMAECILSGMALSYTQMFFSCAVLVTSFLLGPRWACGCAAITCSFVLLNDFVFPGILPQLPGPTELDKTVAYLALIVVVTGCAFFTELTTERYAQSLEGTSDQLRERTRKLDKLVGIDPLTRMPNRHQFQEDTNALIAQADRDEAVVVVWIFDLKDYKSFNERVGHAVGDEVLRKTGERLQNSAADGMRVYRIGGDEFAVTAIRTEFDETEAMSLARNMFLTTLRDGIEADGRLTVLDADIGIATYPRDCANVDELLAVLTSAVDEAKHKENRIAVYEPRMTEFTRRKQRLNERLTKAIQCDEFAVFYQAHIDARTDQIIGAEALLRWEQAGQFIAPIWFVPQLEASGQLVEVGRWVLRKACEDVRAWQLEGHKGLRLAVNVSHSQFKAPGFVDDVVAALQASGLPASTLDVEINESVFKDDLKVAIQTIDQLRHIGAHVSIDDFGMEHSSLRHLALLSLNRLKINREFLRGIPDTSEGIIAASIVSLAHRLGLDVVAEGVESEEQLDFIRSIDCDIYQGHLFATALPSNEFRQLLTRHSSFVPSE